MKPESSAQSPVGSTQAPESSAQVPENSAQEEDMELTDEEKVVLNLLKDNSPIDLNELKGQAGLSNKKWDKAIKGLTKNKLARVEKTDAGLFVSVV
jgi:lysyl-tRNA synthetase, class II